MTDPNDPIHPSVDETVSTESYGTTNSQHFGRNGLTKREYFSAIIMQGLTQGAMSTSETYELNDVAAMAVEAADVLIKSLNREMK